MKTGIIKPEDVNQLIRDGKLSIGDELEFCVNCGFENQALYYFAGYRKACGSELWVFIACNKHGNIVSTEFRYARWPLPDLRDGDPIFTINENGTELVKNFMRFCTNGIVPYPNNSNKWTFQNIHGPIVCWQNWRIPTQNELESAGYDRDYYTKRGIE